MRYLGIDYGHKRIGIALSDEEGWIAFPMAQFSGVVFLRVVREIQKVVKKEKIGKIIIGLPITFGGKESLQARETREFGQKLHNLVQLPIEYENEILSTKMAERGGTAKQKIDSSAAAIILQSYLDKLPTNKSRIIHE